jgi:hypothetical protein
VQRGLGSPAPHEVRSCPRAWRAPSINRFKTEHAPENPAPAADASQTHVDPLYSHPKCAPLVLGWGCHIGIDSISW